MTATFYDELAPYFHLLYGDWERAILKQGAAISSLLGEFGVKSGDRVLDAACGIGTQTLGLAMLGFEVAASDISAGGLKRLRFELSSRYGMRYVDGDRFLAVQVWEWDEDQYDLRLYLTREFADGRCETRVLRSRYYAVSIARLCELLLEAGFVEVQRRDQVLHQPVLVGRRAA
jgi:SAM-dependent methyltransferase